MSLRRPGGMLRTFADRSPTGSELGPWGGKPMSERPARHSGLIPIALLAVTVLIAGACGGSAASTGPSADASAAAPPTSGASQPAVEPSATGGGIVTIAFESDIQYFDPAGALRISSTICWALCLPTFLPHFGQCWTPIDA